MWPASTAIPSEMSSIACAVAPSWRPSLRRIGKRAYDRLAEGGACAPEWAGDDQQIARQRPAPARHAVAPAERGDAQHDRLGRGQVTADDRHARLGDPLVELDHVGHACRRRHGERDHERLGLGARCGEVAEARGGGAPAELAPADPVEPEVDVLDDRVLRDDQPAGELGGVVPDIDDQTAILELGQQAELTELR